MKIKSLNCPSCSVPINEDLQPNQQFTCTACGSTLVLTDLATDDQVICKDCKTVNHDNRRFCKHCGVTLKAGCPFCYSQNNVDVVHCKTCGANLQHAKNRKHSWLEEQRKHKADRIAAYKAAKKRNKEAKLQRLLDDLDEPENHPMAIYELHQLGTEAVESLIDLLTDEDPDARFGAARTLGLIGDSRAIEPLIECLIDFEPAVRYWAIDSLMKFKAKNAVQDIGELLNDKHKGVREHAEVALKTIGGPESKQILQEKKKRKWWPF